MKRFSSQYLFIAFLLKLLCSPLIWRNADNTNPFAKEHYCNLGSVLCNFKSIFLAHIQHTAITQSHLLLRKISYHTANMLEQRVKPEMCGNMTEKTWLPVIPKSFDPIISIKSECTSRTRDQFSRWAVIFQTLWSHLTENTRGLIRLW